jgi:hypothetical protein
MHHGCGSKDNGIGQDGKFKRIAWIKIKTHFPLWQDDARCTYHERLTALETILVFIVSMAGTCAHESCQDRWDTLLTQTEENDESENRMYCILNRPSIDKSTKQVILDTFKT